MSLPDRPGHAFMDALAMQLSDVGAVVERGAVDEPLGPASMRARFGSDVGSTARVGVDFSLIPDPSGAFEGYFNLQSFVDVSSTVTSERSPEVYEMLMAINQYTPIGYFGVFVRLGVLYWKNTAYLDVRVEPERNAQLVISQTDLARRIIADFEIPILDVVSGRASAAQALAESKWGPALFDG